MGVSLEDEVVAFIGVPCGEVMHNGVWANRVVLCDDFIEGNSTRHCDAWLGLFDTPHYAKATEFEPMKAAEFVVFHCSFLRLYSIHMPMG
jgi:hypothetical protein